MCKSYFVLDSLTYVYWHLLGVICVKSKSALVFPDHWTRPICNRCHIRVCRHIMLNVTVLSAFSRWWSLNPRALFDFYVFVPNCNYSSLKGIWLLFFAHLFYAVTGFRFAPDRFLEKLSVRFIGLSLWLLAHGPALDLAVLLKIGHSIFRHFI